MTQEKINQMILNGEPINNIIEAQLKLKSDRQIIYDEILRENKIHNKKFSEHEVSIPMIIFNKIFENLDK